MYFYWSKETEKHCNKKPRNIVEHLFCTPFTLYLSYVYFTIKQKLKVHFSSPLDIISTFFILEKNAHTFVWALLILFYCIDSFICRLNELLLIFWNCFFNKEGQY